jgi:hypothetical protein
VPDEFSPHPHILINSDILFTYLCLVLTSVFFLSGFLISILYEFLIPHTCYMSCPSQPPAFDNICRRVQIIKLLSTQFSPLSPCYVQQVLDMLIYQHFNYSMELTYLIKYAVYILHLISHSSSQWQYYFSNELVRN